MAQNPKALREFQNITQESELKKIVVNLLDHEKIVNARHDHQQ